MEKEFVPYEQALALKELGFDEPCFGFYNDMENNKPMGGNFPCDGRNSAPLYQQAFRWFREKYDLHVFFPMLGANLISFEIKSFGNKNGNCVQNVYDGIVYDNLYYQPEEAELECLKKLIEICKKN
jgi:hypothetical protein